MKPEALLKYWKPLAVAALLIGMAGCSTTSAPVKLYDGATRPAIELALVSVPEEIEVMSVDGHEPPPSFLKSRVQLALLPGEHVFSLRYVELFQLNADEHDVVRSKQAALRFTAAAGAEYRLQIPKQTGVEVARKFAKDPQFALVNVKEGGSVQSTAIKSYAEASLIDTITKAFDGSAKEEAEGPVTNVDLLKDVWGRASTEERAAFRRWLETQGK